MNNGVEYKETTTANGEPALQILVSGTAYRNLRRIADALNATEECDTDNTPLTIVRGFSMAFEIEYMDIGGENALEVAVNNVADGMRDQISEANYEKLVERFNAIEFEKAAL